MAVGEVQWDGEAQHPADRHEGGFRLDRQVTVEPRFHRRGVVIRAAHVVTKGSRRECPLVGRLWRRLHRVVCVRHVGVADADRARRRSRHTLGLRQCDEVAAVVRAGGAVDEARARTITRPPAIPVSAIFVVVDRLRVVLARGFGHVADLRQMDHQVDRTRRDAIRHAVGDQARMRPDRLAHLVGVADLAEVVVIPRELAVGDRELQLRRARRRRLGGAEKQDGRREPERHQRRAAKPFPGSVPIGSHSRSGELVSLRSRPS